MADRKTPQNLPKKHGDSERSDPSWISGARKELLDRLTTELPPKLVSRLPERLILPAVKLCVAQVRNREWNVKAHAERGASGSVGSENPKARAAQWISREWGRLMSEILESEYLADLVRLAPALEPGFAPADNRELWDEIRAYYYAHWMVSPPASGRKDPPPCRAERLLGQYLPRRQANRDDEAGDENELSVSAESRTDFADALGFLTRKIFFDEVSAGGDVFFSVVRKYDPALGKSWSAFLAYLIERRFLDWTRTLKSGTKDQGFLPSGEGPWQPASDAAEPGAANFVTPLESLSWFNPQSADFDPVARMLVDLHYKAYVDPRHYEHVTITRLKNDCWAAVEILRRKYHLRRAKALAGVACDRTLVRREIERAGIRHMPRLLKPFAAEYWDCQEEFRQLVEVDIPEAHEDSAQHFRELLEGRDRLRTLGFESRAIGKLEIKGRTVANADGIGRVEAKLKDLEDSELFSGASGRNRQRRITELRFILLAARHENSRKRLERLLSEDGLYEKFNKSCHPWVRNQSELERIVGIKQYTLSRTYWPKIRLGDTPSGAAA